MGTDQPCFCRSCLTYRTNDKAMKVITKTAPFLQADTASADITAVNDHIFVKMTGKVYSFTNSAFFYDGKTPVMPRVDLNSTAPDPWK